MSQTTRLVIVSRPTFIKAELWHNPAIINDVLEVSHSPVVECTDECFTPVVDFLSARCSREYNWERFEDASYMFGERIQTEHTIYAACPGDSVEHNCVNARMERVDRERKC